MGLDSSDPTAHYVYGLLLLRRIHYFDNFLRQSTYLDAFHSRDIALLSVVCSLHLVIFLNKALIRCIW